MEGLQGLQSVQGVQGVQSVQGLIAMVSYMVICCITPGPNNVICMNNGTKCGFRKSMPFCLGVVIGSSVLLMLSTACNVFLVSYIPRIQQVLTYLGAVYILYLAWTIWRDKPKKKKADGKKGSSLDTTSFYTAFLLQAVNPKGLIYAMTLISGFFFPHTLYMFLGILLGNAGILFLSLLVWVAFGALFQTFLERHKKVTNAIMALLLVYCAFSLF